MKWAELYPSPPPKRIFGICSSSYDARAQTLTSDKVLAPTALAVRSSVASGTQIQGFAAVASVKKWRLCP